MTETPTTMNPEEEKTLAAEVSAVAGAMLEKEVAEFSATLGEDVKIVPRGNTVSIKRKNKNFVYMMKGKRVPLTAVWEEQYW